MTCTFEHFLSFVAVECRGHEFLHEVHSRKLHPSATSVFKIVITWLFVLFVFRKEPTTAVASAWSGWVSICETKTSCFRWILARICGWTSCRNHPSWEVRDQHRKSKVYYCKYGGFDVAFFRIDAGIVLPYESKKSVPQVIAAVTSAVDDVIKTCSVSCKAFPFFYTDIMYIF